MVLCHVASDIYDAKGNIMYTSELSSYQFAESASTGETAPVWTDGDFWNFSVSMPEFFGVTYDEYYQMTVTGSDTVSGKECYRVSIEGKATLTIDMGGVQTKTIDEQSGVACYAKGTLSLVHENLTMTSKLETSGFGDEPRSRPKLMILATQTKIVMESQTIGMSKQRWRLIYDTR